MRNNKSTENYSSIGEYLHKMQMMCIDDNYLLNMAYEYRKSISREQINICTCLKQFFEFFRHINTMQTPVVFLPPAKHDFLCHRKKCGTSSLFLQVLNSRAESWP